MARKDPESRKAYDRERKRIAQGYYTSPRRTKDFRKAELAEGRTIGDPLPAPAKVLRVNGPSHGLKIAVLPDCQVKPGVNTDHLEWFGKYVAAKRPDVIVCIGDFADMESLSTWEKDGSLAAEGKRYAADISSAKAAMRRFLTPIRKAKGYKPRMVMTLGNHEDRITRAVNENPRKLEGLMSLSDLDYEGFGWEVIPYLQPVVIGGVAFCHFFPAGVMGRPITSPAAILQKMHMSAFAGHLQGRQIAFAKRGDGVELTAIISGSFYSHEEAYLSPMTNVHWRGAWFLHEVKDGTFDDMAISIGFLKRKYA